MLEIDGDGFNAGVVDNAQNLSAIVSGTNGLILLGDGYSTSSPWSDQIESATTLADLDGGTIENGSITFLLVAEFSATAGVDLDTDNDGLLDFFPWSNVLDGVGWTDGGSADQVYTSASLVQAGTPEAATRIVGDSQTESLNSWFNGEIAGTSDSVNYGFGSSNLPANAEITPGAENFGAVDRAFELGDVNRDGLVDFSDIGPFISILASDGFSEEADADQDGVVSFFDISLFISLLAAS